MQIANLSLVKELNSWPAGSALRLEATFADGSVRFYHKLKGPPAKGETAVLFDCEVAGGLLRIRNREDGGGMACEVSQNSILNIWLAGTSPPVSLHALRLTPLPPSSWEEACSPVPRYDLRVCAGSPLAVTLWPTPAVPQSASGHAEPTLAVASVLRNMRESLEGKTELPAAESSESEDEAAMATLEAEIPPALKRKMSGGKWVGSKKAKVLPTPEPGALPAGAPASSSAPASSNGAPPSESLAPAPRSGSAPAPTSVLASSFWAPPSDSPAPAPSSGSAPASSSAVPPSDSPAPAPSSGGGAPDVHRAAKNSRMFLCDGRGLFDLKRGGVSLQCQFHVGEDCWKDVGFGKDNQLDRAECIRRLLAWESDCRDEAGVLISRDAHVRTGGPLLRWYAAPSG